MERERRWAVSAGHGRYSGEGAATVVSLMYMALGLAVFILLAALIRACDYL